MPGERSKQGDLGQDRDQPDPPGQVPEAPMLRTADDREQQLKTDYEDDRRRSLPAGLDLFLAQGVARHAQIVRVVRIIVATSCS
jgi:hypothetical protein